MLRFRLQCRTEKKVGMIALGFGRAYWVDANGEYMDGNVLEAEKEVIDLLAQLQDKRAAE
ncbi:hypothetical protein D3C71_2200020 [compost metagenome]